jgi:molybdopterin converting factor small subunit
MTMIRIPTPLRPFTAGMNEVAVSGHSVRDALESLVLQYPEVKPHLFDEDGAVRSYVNIFVNDEDIRSLQGHDTPVSEEDRLMIIPSIAGGQKQSG